MTRKHISDIELCDDTQSRHRFAATCENYHRDDFCLLCGYELEGDRLYMEIHGPTGWDSGKTDIDSAQPYVCMECVRQFRSYSVRPSQQGAHSNYLSDFIKEKK